MDRSRNARLRAATNEDGPAVEALVFAVLQEYGLAPDPGGIDTDLRDIEGAYGRGGGAFDVLEEDGRLIGCVGVFPADAATCELRKMYLAPGARGRGLGRRLLESALAHARARGFRRVVLETASVLVEAIALYERYGFTPYAADHLSKRCDQAYVLDLARAFGTSADDEPS
jgi:putative acetyltransferase